LLRYFTILKSRFSSGKSTREQPPSETPAAVSPPGQRSDPGIWRIPFSFSITREGGVYLLSIVLVSLAAVRSGNNLLFLILAVLLSTIIVSGTMARSSLRSLSLTVQIPENVFEGERISIKVSLRNMKRYFPSFSILVENVEISHLSPTSAFGSRLPFLKRHRPAAPPKAEDRSLLRHPAYFPILRAAETRSELIAQTFPSRGPYRLEGFWISTRFPFGFFRRGERIPSEGEILVYPSIREVSSYFHLLPFLPGQSDGFHVGHGENLYTIRKHQAQESVRAIDWKATAKTGELMAREYARNEESRFCLILDTRISNGASSEYAPKFEKAVSLTASLAFHFFEEGAELELLTPGQHITRDEGMEQLYRILRALAVIECRPSLRENPSDLRDELSKVVDPSTLQHILSDKIFKIIITSRPKGGFPSHVWRSSHVIYFDEL
jgi:uncharacterized protein (DUF58 family)